MGGGQSGQSQRAQMAKRQFGSQRTEFAAERTVLANERTYAAWMRTGLAALVSGLAALRFMKEVLANWALLAVALALLAFATFSFAVGVWRYVHMGRSLAESTIAQVKSWLVVAATLLLLATALIAIGSALPLW
jgi:putative membrane protein